MKFLKFDKLISKLNQFKTYFLKHKIRSSILLIIVLLVGYGVFKSLNKANAETRYVLTAVEKGTLVASLEGSGQVSASDQVDIQPRASGDVTAVYVKEGQTVKSGTLLVQINAKDALKSVRDAQANLASAQLALEKLQKPTDSLTILQAENSLTSAQETKQRAEDDLTKSYDDGFNTVANVFLQLPDIMTNLEDILYGFDYSKTQANLDYYSDSVKNYSYLVAAYRDDADNSYQTARTAYDKNFNDYKLASRASDPATITSLISETYDTTKAIAGAIKNTNNLIRFYKDQLNDHDIKPSVTADTHLSSLSSYTGTTNTFLLNLLSIKNTIQNDEETIISSQRSIDEKTASLAKIKEGTDELDLRSQQLTIQQRQNALRDAQEKLADYSVRAPFDGIVAEVNAKKGDTVSSGTAVVTLITQQKIAEISLNEVDAAKIKVGQKATLTFDAISELTLTGTVSNVDTIGTVSQGVVDYGIKIVFDTQDDRVKPGMTVSATIITEAKPDVLMVPSSAVKTLGETSYVEILENLSVSSTADYSAGITSESAPIRQTVIIGLSNDTMTEIVSGLNEGDYIVSRTVTATAAKTANGNSMFQMGGSSRSGGTGGGAPMRR